MTTLRQVAERAVGKKKAKRGKKKTITCGPPSVALCVPHLEGEHNRRYELQLVMSGLPALTNEMYRKGWRAVRTEQTKWKQAVIALAYTHRPAKPLKKARLTITRHSSVEPDYDGNAGSGKSIIDGLVISKIIQDDKMSNIGRPIYKWVKAPATEGHVSVFVEELLEGEDVPV